VLKGRDAANSKGNSMVCATYGFKTSSQPLGTNLRKFAASSNMTASTFTRLNMDICTYDV
jgi:hypothetical protein